MHEKIFVSGEIVHSGIYTCTDCGLKIFIRDHHPIPLCPRCKNHEFTI